MAAARIRSVLVTGCSEGSAGNALALAFHERGLRVFATARSLKNMTNLAGRGIETLTLDVTDQESISALKSEIAKRTGGKLDILFNNAGIMYEAPGVEADPASVRKMFDTNVFGVFNMVSAFTPLLIASVPGSTSAPTIVNVSSVLARIPFPFASAYNASKAAVCSYSDTIRLELSPLGIRVATLFMGEVSTGLMQQGNINFGQESIYADLEGRVKERIAHHSSNSIAADAFAKQVVSEVLDREKASYIWKGTNALLIWFLNAIGPRNVFDSTMKKTVGLDDKSLLQKIYERGQKLVTDVAASNP